MLELEHQFTSLLSMVAQKTNVKEKEDRGGKRRQKRQGYCRCVSVQSPRLHTVMPSANQNTDNAWFWWGFSDTRNSSKHLFVNMHMDKHMLGVANADTEPLRGWGRPQDKQPAGEQLQTVENVGGDRAQPQARQRPGWVSRAESRAGTQWGGAQRKEEVGVGGWGAGRARHGHERLKQETHLVEGESQWAEPRNRAEKTKARPEEATISRQETAVPWQAATGQHSSPGLAWRSPICGKGTAVQEDKWKLQQQTLALMTSLHSCLIPLSGKTVEGQNRSQRRLLRKPSIQTSLLDSLVLQIRATCQVTPL